MKTSSMTEKLCRSVTFHTKGELHVSRLQEANKTLLKISRAVCSKNLSVYIDLALEGKTMHGERVRLHQIGEQQPNVVLQLVGMVGS